MATIPLVDRFLKEISKLAKMYGMDVNVYSLNRGFGLDLDEKYEAVKLFELLNILTIKDASVKLTDVGEKLVVRCIRIANHVITNHLDFKDDRGRVLGKVLYICSRMMPSWRNIDDALNYLDTVLEKLEELREKNYDKYLAILGVIGYYNKYAHEDILTEILKIEEIQAEIT